MRLVLFNSGSIVQPRTGLNRHRRGYAIKEAASGVHFQDVGSYWARLVSYFNIIFHHLYSITIGINSFKNLYSRVSEALDFYWSYSTSMADDPSILVIRDISRNW